jgi:uncharacterized protein
MAKAVLDTNVVVSGLRNLEGPSASLLKLAESKVFRCYVSREILTEYEEVLRRENLGLNRVQIRRFMRMVRRTVFTVAPKTKIQATSDPNDNMFLECALHSRADYVVTGNLRHFPGQFQDIRIVSPRQFLTILAAEPSLK